jgi:hypothetical protein
VPVLSHRVLATLPGAFEGSAAGRRERDAIKKILDEVPVPL